MPTSCPFGRDVRGGQLWKGWPVGGSSLGLASSMVGRSVDARQIMTVDVLWYGTMEYYDMMVRRGTVICGSESKYVKQFKQFKQLEPLSRGNDETPPSTRYCSAGFTSASYSIASGHGRGLRSIASYFRSFGRHPERDIVALQLQVLVRSRLEVLPGSIRLQQTERPAHDPRSQEGR